MANFLTVGRILLIIPFTWMFFLDASWAMSAAFVIFAAAAATDFIDGFVARARGEVSALGAALDPIADKLLVAAALLLLTRNGVIHGAAVTGALLILMREILVSGLREALIERGHSLPATYLAKIKTTVQMLALAFLVAASPGGIITQNVAVFTSAAIWIAVVLTLWTGAAYVAQAVRLLRSPSPEK